MWVGNEQGAYGQDAHETVIPVDDNQTVGVFGYFGVPTQVTHDDIKGQIGSDRDGIGTHQTTGHIVGERQHRGDTGAIGLVHDRQNLLGDGFRQVMQDVCNIVVIKLPDDGGQCLGLHFYQKLVSEFLGEFVQDLRFLLSLQQAPKHLPDPGRVGGDQVSGIAGREVADNARNISQGAGIQGAIKLRKLRFCFNRGIHGSPSVLRRALSATACQAASA